MNFQIIEYPEDHKRLRQCFPTGESAKGRASGSEQVEKPAKL